MKSQIKKQRQWARAAAACAAALGLGTSASAFVGAESAPKAAPVSAGPAPAQTPADSGPKPWEKASNNAPNSRAATVGGVAANQLAVGSEAFDKMALAAIAAHDFEALKALYSSGTTPAFDNSRYCLQTYRVGGGTAPLDNLADAANYGSLGALTDRDRDLIASDIHGTFPTSCGKLHMLQAVASAPAVTWSGHGEGVGGINPAREAFGRSCQVNLAGRSLGDADRANKRAESAKAYDEMMARDEADRKIIALIDANTPAADKYLYPFYAVRVLRQNRDFTLAKWFMRKWAEALPDIRKARELGHPGREAFEQAWSKRKRLDGRDLGPRGVRPGFAETLRSKVSVTFDADSLLGWRSSADDAEKPLAVAVQLFKMLPALAEEDAAALDRLWELNHVRDNLGRQNPLQYPIISKDALDAFQKSLGWSVDEIVNLKARTRLIDEADPARFEAWDKASRIPILCDGTHGRKAEALDLLREVMAFPGVKERLVALQEPATGMTLLHFFAERSKRVHGPFNGLVSRALLEMGAPYNLQDSDGSTPQSVLIKEIDKDNGGAATNKAYVDKDFPREFFSKSKY